MNSSAADGEGSMSLTRRRFVSASLAGAVLPFAAKAQLAPPLPGSAAPPQPFGSPPLPNGQTAISVLQAGERVVWLGSSASIPGERYQIVPDPNGGWINKRTGQHYTQFETPG